MCFAIMSNREYDRLYDELVRLEEETGIVLSSSPTVNVGYEVVSSLPKKQHPSPMLSLDKTKDPAALAAWLGDQEGLLSWKLDGLTIVLTYTDGQLSDAVTRGDGITGEVITGNAKVFDNVPLTIPAKEETVIRGEAVISYPQFEQINASIEEAEARYKNPRNLCSGTVRQLDSSVTAGRHVLFYAFSLASGGGDLKRRRDQMEWLRAQGFETVENIPVNKDTVEDAVAAFAERIADFDKKTEKVYVNEVNTLPGFTKYSMFPSLWADEGVEFTELIEKIVEYGYERYRVKDNRKTVYWD